VRACVALAVLALNHCPPPKVRSTFGGLKAAGRRTGSEDDPVLRLNRDQNLTTDGV